MQQHLQKVQLLIWVGSFTKKEACSSIYRGFHEKGSLSYRELYIKKITGFRSNKSRHRAYII